MPQGGNRRRDMACGEWQNDIFSEIQNTICRRCQKLFDGSLESAHSRLDDDTNTLGISGALASQEMTSRAWHHERPLSNIHHSTLMPYWRHWFCSNQATHGLPTSYSNSYWNDANDRNGLKGSFRTLDLSSIVNCLLLALKTPKSRINFNFSLRPSIPLKQSHT